MDIKIKIISSTAYVHVVLANVTDQTNYIQGVRTCTWFCNTAIMNDVNKAYCADLHEGQYRRMWAQYQTN